MAKANTVHRRISESQFTALVKPMIGLPVSRAWRGHGSACFLEIGELHDLQLLDGEVSAQGEFGVMIEWSWRIESSRSIVCGSWSTEQKINKGIKDLADSFVEEILISNRLPEIAVRLSSKRWLQSFCTTSGQPRWAIFLRHFDNTVWITVMSGKLILESAVEDEESLDQFFDALEQ
jgi:hypothetical protein